MINRFLRWLFQPKFRKNATVYYVGGGWGDAINWMDIKTRTVCGWKDNRPQVGDELRSKMQSGKIGRFVFTLVDLCNDPTDMFFGKVYDKGYVDESPTAPEAKGE